MASDATPPTGAAVEPRGATTEPAGVGVEASGAGVGPAGSRVQRRTVALLVSTQVLGGIGVAIGFTVGTLLAAVLSGSPSYAGLAASAGVVGAALIAVPVSRVMDRRGRRPGLVLAYVLGVLGAGLVVVGGLIESFALAMVGMTLFGGGTAGNLQARYAATDLASPARRGTALSTVVWATTIGAVAGPNLADPTGAFAASLGVPALAGPFLLSMVMFGLSALILGLFLRPDPLLYARRLRAAADDSARPVGVPAGLAVAPPRASVRSALRTVRASPDALLGLGAVAVCHAAMVGLMSMTPVHMQHGGASLSVVGFVISVHVAGMFAFSPLVGMVSDRVGRRQVIIAGGLLQLVACVVAGTAGERDSVQLGVGLTLLGLGWSCALVAGSTLLTESVPADERPSVQGSADFVMGMAGAGAGLLAGVAVGVGSYAILAGLAAIAVLPLLAAALRPR